MRLKPVIPREEASRDIEEAIAYLLSEGDSAAALGFIDSLERAFAHISHYPASGSSRYASELDLPGLRHWPLKNYPQLVFYVNRGDHIDVWRVLHGSRDIPAWMRESDD